MKEAVEIAKLRLFLKLVALIEPNPRKNNYGLEPLPDIDFNIRSGNTLIGFATEEQLNSTVKDFEGEMTVAKGKPMYQEKLDELKMACDTTAAALEHWRLTQLGNSSNSKQLRFEKEKFRTSLDELNDKLDHYLAHTYGFDPKNQKKFEDWKEKHRPFHWLASFYEIIHSGGFDVVIGNPPYVEYSTIKNNYQIKDIKCISAGNLYAFVIERSFSILNQKSRMGMIIQLSAFCTPRMLSFQEQWLGHSVQSFLSFFDDRPGKLFDGLEHIRVAICINEFGNTTNKNIWTTNYIKFISETREILFDSLSYIRNNGFINNTIPKLNKKVEQDILVKINKDKRELQEFFERNTANKLYYHNAPQYFIRAHSFIPYFWNEKDGEKISVQNKNLSFSNRQRRDVGVTILSSSIFYWWFVLQSDCRHLNAKEINEFPINFDVMTTEVSTALENIAKLLEKDLKKNAYRKEANYKATGKVIYDEFYPKKSKVIINEIDTVLARHYGLSDDELDFIVNFDIKYRMGGELGEEE
jgi:hypothetical protein